MAEAQIGSAPESSPRPMRALPPCAQMLIQFGEQRIRTSRDIPHWPAYDLKIAAP